MTWKRWKIGLLISLATGGLTALIGLGVGINLRQALYLLGISMAKDLLLYLTDPNYRDKMLSALPGDSDENKKNQTP